LDATFYIDPATGLPHIYDHDAREDEAIDVLNDAGEDRAGQDGARIAVGQTAAGRYLRVIYVPDRELDRVFVITHMIWSGSLLWRIGDAEGRSSNESKQISGWMGRGEGAAGVGSLRKTD
jgi:hypothetical protein